MHINSSRFSVHWFWFILLSTNWWFGWILFIQHFSFFHGSKLDSTFVERKKEINGNKNVAASHFYEAVMLPWPTNITWPPSAQDLCPAPDEPDPILNGKTHQTALLGITCHFNIKPHNFNPTAAAVSPRRTEYNQRCLLVLIYHKEPVNKSHRWTEDPQDPGE